MKVYLNNKFIDEEKATINIKDRGLLLGDSIFAVSYTHLRAHETDSYLVCRLLLEKKN